MDALPVTEQTTLPFASKVRATFLGQDVGVMHACGHDIHTAVQLGVASVLTAMKSEVPGTIKFIFQPAEEGPPPGEAGGASLMVKEGVLQNPKPQAIFALHMMSEMTVGDIGYSEGPALAASDTWEVKIVGKQAHGARPELSIDPIVTAAEFALALQTIRSRNLAGSEPGVVTIGAIHGGQRQNIIPTDVTLLGTVRTFRPEMSALIEQRMRTILKGVTEANGATGEVTRYERGAPATINDLTLTRESVPALERALGKDHVSQDSPGNGVGGLLLLRQRDSRLLLPARAGQTGDNVERSPHADVRRRRQRDPGGREGDELPPPRLSDPAREVVGPFISAELRLRARHRGAAVRRILWPVRWGVIGGSHHYSKSEDIMRSVVGLVVALAVVVSVSASAQQKPGEQTWKGTISDSNCKEKHPAGEHDGKKMTECRLHGRLREEGREVRLRVGRQGLSDRQSGLEADRHARRARG